MISKHSATAIPSVWPTTALDWTIDLRTPVVLILAGLLLAQLLLASVLGLTGRSLAPPVATATLLDFVPDRIARVRIEGPDGADRLTLERRASGWALAELGDFPVQGAKVEQLLDSLAALQRPPPIAASAEARERFRVADDGFERRVTLEDDRGSAVSLLAGDAPGFRRLLARPAGDAGVHELRLALADLSNRRDDWIDRDVLRLAAEDIRRIASDDWILIRIDGGWELAADAGSGDASQRPLDPERAETLARALASLGYRGVLGVADDPGYRLDAPRLLLKVELADGRQREYRLSQAEGSQDYVLKTSDLPYYFKLAGFDLEGLLDADPRLNP